MTIENMNSFTISAKMDVHHTITSFHYYFGFGIKALPNPFLFWQKKRKKAKESPRQIKPKIWIIRQLSKENQN